MTTSHLEPGPDEFVASPGPSRGWEQWRVGQRGHRERCVHRPDPACVAGQPIAPTVIQVLHDARDHLSAGDFAAVELVRRQLRRAFTYVPNPVSGTLFMMMFAPVRIWSVTVSEQLCDVAGPIGGQWLGAPP